MAGYTGVVGSRVLQIQNSLTNVNDSSSTTVNRTASGNGWEDAGGGNTNTAAYLSFPIKQTGSKVVVTAYSQCYSTNSNGNNMVVAHKNSAGNWVTHRGDNAWSRSYNGWTGSSNIGRQITISHDLSEGDTLELKMEWGSWTSGSCTKMGYSGYLSPSGMVAMEMAD